ncbi:MAG: phosphotransferase [Phycisphaerales bacterium]
MQPGAPGHDPSGGRGEGHNLAVGSGTASGSGALGGSGNLGASGVPAGSGIAGSSWTPSGVAADPAARALEHAAPTPPLAASPPPADAGAPAPRPPRARFEAGELAMVCSHYDVGVIEAIKEFRRGSGRAPKVVFKTDRGRFLLKRRPAGGVGTEAQARIQFCHAIQLFLSKRHFPLPRLIRTRTDGRTMLARGESIYELFEFIDGGNYDMSLDATADAGRALALFHRLLSSFHLHGYSPPCGSFHSAPGLEPHLALAGRRLNGSTAPALERLRAAYAEAAHLAGAQGFIHWPAQIIHGDWHPGNMLFKGSRVAAVIDYDTARQCPRAVDIANGALQFSITMRGPDPARWPVGLDEGRLKRFLRGYETVPGSVISVAELESLPWLMVEALIVEAVVPIAATGTFAGLSGSAFLGMVDANVDWIRRNARRIAALVSE